MDNLLTLDLSLTLFFADGTGIVTIIGRQILNLIERFF